MAFATTKSGRWFAKGIHECKWTLKGTTVGNGAVLDAPTLPDKSIHIHGVFGGGTVIIQGSNGPATVSVYHTLNDANGNALSFTTSGIEQILENTRLIRPRFSAAAAATTSITVRIMSRSELR
jgi:hypothetical protein